MTPKAIFQITGRAEHNDYWSDDFQEIVEEAYRQREVHGRAVMILQYEQKAPFSKFKRVHLIKMIRKYSF